MSRKGKLVYSSESGTQCQICGHRRDRCRCPDAVAAKQTVPDKIVAKLRVEKSGRKGKIVTVVDGLPTNRVFLEGLAKELKAACASGGTAAASHVEIQGDHRDRLRGLLEKKGWTVKG
jgi:translation initiation factor 1